MGVGTGAIYITVAALLWGKKTILLSRQELNLPLVTYLVNFAFGATITIVALDNRFLLPVGLSILLGVVPAFIFWWISKANQSKQMDISPENIGNNDSLKVATTDV